MSSIHCDFIFRPYTPFNGMPSTVWFDRKQISAFVPEDNESMDEICLSVDALIEREVQSGIPRNKIIIGNCMQQKLCLTYIWTDVRDPLRRD